MSDSNKSEKPTPQRRKKAREQGQVARSRELSGALGCMAALSVLVWQSADAPNRWRNLFRNCLELSATQSVEAGGPILYWTFVEVARWAVPALLAAWMFSTAAGVMQGGFVFATEALAFKIERISPGSKLKQIFSLSGLSGIAKSLVPFSAIAYIGCEIVVSNRSRVMQASFLSLGSLARLLGAMLIEITWKSGLILLCWAGVDYFINWRKQESELMMSKEDVRREHKENEGDPVIKGRIRRLQRQMRRQQMLRDVEKATVVITNPTHFAVALRYEMSMQAPIVVAKGRDLLAEKLKSVARWQGIPIMENPPLAQALYRSVEVGHAIPSKLYTAVAEILAFVFQIQQQQQNKNKRPTQ